MMPFSLMSSDVNFISHPYMLVGLFAGSGPVRSRRFGPTPASGSDDRSHISRRLTDVRSPLTDTCSSPQSQRGTQDSFIVIQRHIDRRKNRKSPKGTCFKMAPVYKFALIQMQPKVSGRVLFSCQTDR